MFLLRVVIPDRPGSLGALASALGEVGADIQALEVVERGSGAVVDDLMLNLPPGAGAERLYAACATLDDVDILWVSYYPETWGLQSDVDTLDRMLAAPDDAPGILVAAAPEVFHTAWALSVDTHRGVVLSHTAAAPHLTATEVSRLAEAGPLGSLEMAAGWADGWPPTLLAMAPLPTAGHAIVLGRNGGPAFLPSEIARLRLLAALADPEIRHP